MAGDSTTIIERIKFKLEWRQKNILYNNLRGVLLNKDFWIYCNLISVSLDDNLNLFFLKEKKSIPQFCENWT